MRQWIDLFEARLDEIAPLSDSDFGEKHRREQIGMLLNYRDWTLLADLGDIRYRWRREGGTIDVLMVRDKVAIGYALLQASEYAGIPGHHMTEIGLSRWEHEGNRYGARLYDTLLDRDFVLFSGAQQTRSGRAMWLRLIKRGVVTAIVDDEIVPLDSVDPWSPGVVLMARKLTPDTSTT